jgi:hypothetical protein
MSTVPCAIAVAPRMLGGPPDTVVGIVLTKFSAYVGPPDTVVGIVLTKFSAYV